MKDKNSKDITPVINFSQKVEDFYKNYDTYGENFQFLAMELCKRDLKDVSNKSGSAIFKESKLLVNFYNEILLIDLEIPEVFILTVDSAGNDKSAPELNEKNKNTAYYLDKIQEKKISEIIQKKGLVPAEKFIASLVMHYLNKADGTPLSGEWINYRELPGGMFYSGTIPGILKPLGLKYQASGSDFIEKIINLGGRQNSIAKYAGEIYPFIRFPILIILEEKDEEFDQNIIVSFDRSAQHYLKTDIIKTIVVLTVKKFFTKLQKEY